MPLDLAALGPQLSRFAAHAKEEAPRARQRLAVALEVLREHSGEHAELARLADERQTPFRAARPVERLDTRRALPATPADYTVVATDGSHVGPDRHGPVLCHLINVGSALIRYGRDPGASLESEPLLRYLPEEVSIVLPGRDPALVDDRLLGIMVHVAETGRLADLAERTERDRPIVGLLDGTLLVSSWGRGSETHVLEHVLQKFLACLDRLQAAGIPLASYVSRPRSSDVVNILRLAECPNEDSRCESCAARDEATLVCDEIADLPDRVVFEALPLAEGERSGLFASSWSTSTRLYGQHRVHFFYMNVGREIARVEVPGWVARDPTSLDLVQSIVFEQARRGQGYPRVLIEAHEKAVITASDRRIFATLMEQALASSGVTAGASEKEASKRLRGL
jgi:hypothetical protein